MTSSAEQTKTILELVSAEAVTPIKVLEQLDTIGIEWFLTEEGDLMIKSWQVAAERFVSPEDVPMLQDDNVAADAEPLNWVSANLASLRAQYPDQWIAVQNRNVRAAAPSLPELLALIEEQGLEEAPFITQIPATEVTWSMAYAGQIV